MKNHSPINNNNGYTMLMALFLLVFISVIGFSLLTTASNTNKTTSNERVEQAAFYIAEAGLTQTVSALNQLVIVAYNEATAIYNSLPETEKKIEVLTNEFQARTQSNIIVFNNYTYDNFESINNIKPSSTIIVNTIENRSELGYYVYQIVSTGSIGERKRTVSQEIIINLKLDSGGVPDNEILTKKALVEVE